MNVALWIVAGLLAAAYLFSGGGKLILAKERIGTMSTSAGWVEDFSAGSVRAIGILEVLGAVGLILPAVLDIAPVMVPVTAVCWALLMVGAMIVHGRLGQFTFVMLNSVYLALAAFVAWGRLGLEPFTGG